MKQQIAVMIDDLFEDVEYIEPKDAFQSKGYKIVHVGKERKKVKGKKKNTEVLIDVSAAEAKVADFDAMFIPGGFSPDNLRTDKDAVQFTHDFVKSGKPVFFICHGAQLLITARVLEGKKVTGYTSIIEDIKNAGAEFIDQEVVVDNNLISSRNPEDIPAFISSSIDALEKK